MTSAASSSRQTFNALRRGSNASLIFMRFPGVAARQSARNRAPPACAATPYRWEFKLSNTTASLVKAVADGPRETGTGPSGNIVSGSLDFA
jgi:hypothetical protein